MGEKDITHKILESYNDVFADIVNVLVFNGEQVVSPDDLVDRTPYGFYKAAGKVHEEERDIAKLWQSGPIRLSCLGMENQEEPDPDMPLRVMGYDGAEYRAQLLSDNEGKDRYAVLTLVLYYGYKHRWSGPLRLKDRVLIPEGTEHLFSDHKINLFQIAYLTREQVNMFRSDFRVVADYFVQKRETGTYVGSQYEMQHVDAVLQLLRVFEKDDRFDTMSQAIVDTEQFKEGESFTMCDVLDMYINQGREAGLTEGRVAGLEEGTRTERERIIRTMAADNPDPDLISRLLHLDLSYVQEVMARKA